MQDTKDSDERQILSAKVSSLAAEGWRKFCSQNGISLSAMLEVAGRELHNETMPPTVEARKRMVETARAVDIERRTRKKS